MKMCYWYALSNRLYKWCVPLLPWFLSLLMCFIFALTIPGTTTIGRGAVFGYGGLWISTHGRAVSESAYV